jgi:non-ribosomal peptide synthetase component E (peptide arylation enzyme)
MDDGIWGTRTFWELVEARAARTPDAPMLFDEHDRGITFGEFRDRVARVAAGLHTLGVGEGTPVCWQLPARIETVVLSFALSRLGATQSPIIPLYRGREVGYVLDEARAAFMFIPGVWRGHDFPAMVADLELAMHP